MKLFRLLTGRAGKSQPVPAIADKPRSDSLQQFLYLPAETKAARFLAFEAEVETENGVGFILAGGPNYRPTYDLSRLILRVRSLVADDRYEPYTVSLRGTIDDHSFREYSSGAEPVLLIERGTELADAICKVRGTASVFGRLRPEHDPSYDKHWLSIELIECGDSKTQQFLSSRLNQNPWQRALVQLSAGPLLCIVSASQYETQSTLARFQKPLSEILDSA